AVTQMISQGAQETFITQRTQGTLNGEPITVEGRDAADFNKDMQYSGDWPKDDNVALLPEFEKENYAIGDTLTLNIGGQEQAITLMGFYTVDWNSISSASSLIV